MNNISNTILNNGKFTNLSKTIPPILFNFGRRRVKLYLYGQKIYERVNDEFVYNGFTELLFRPLGIKTDFFYNTLNAAELSDLTLLQILWLDDLLNKNAIQLDGANIVSINVELSSIYFIQWYIIKLSKSLRKKNKSLVIEITERERLFSRSHISAIYNFYDNGIELALDDVTFGEINYLRNLRSFSECFTVIKFKFEIFCCKNIDINDLMFLVEDNKKIIIEGIENSRELGSLSDMTFTHIQGFHFDIPKLIL